MHWVSKGELIRKEVEISVVELSLLWTGVCKTVCCFSRFRWFGVLLYLKDKGLPIDPQRRTQTKKDDKDGAKGKESRKKQKIAEKQKTVKYMKN